MNDEPIPLEDEIYEEEIEVEEEPSVMMAMWGEITGDIENQTDLKEALDAKQDNLTQSQLDAVNSGIDSTKVETYDGYQAQINTKASQSALETEAEARRQADSTLQGNIDAEETARKASDKDIQDVLDGETLARQNADTALGGRIDTEIHDRQVADIALQGQIDAITSKSDVVDVVATYADLQAYDTQHLGNNDVIKVLDDETRGDALTYYRWSKTNQTWTFIGQEAPYYSKSQTDTLLLGKQNTIDSSHKLSADLVDDTSTTNKFVTASDITNWNGKQDALTAGTGIDITGGIISTPAIVPEVVTELPTTGAEGKLYLTPKAHTTTTATGNPITATVAEEAGAIESFQLDGDTYQQTYTGINLAKNAYRTETVSGVTFTASADGSITANGTATDRIDYYINSSARYSLSAGTYVLSTGGSDGTSETYFVYVDNTTGQNWSSRADRSNTITSDYSFEASVRIVVRSGVAMNNVVFKIQIEAGSTPSTFQPYVGGQPSPNPDYPQQIQTVTGTQTVEVVGKNLFDIDSIITGYELISATGEVRANAEWWVTPLIPVKAGEAYTSSNMRVLNKVFYNENGDFVSTITTQTATAPTGASYVRMNAKLTDLSNYTGKAQLELGSTATTYTPYSKQTLPISLGSLELCKLGTYQDYIYKDGEDWKVHKATNTKVYDGTNQGFNYRFSTGVSGKYRFQLYGSVEERSIPRSNSGLYFDGLCNETLAGSRNMTFSSQNSGDNVIAPTTESGYGYIGLVYVAAISEMTLDEANAWLATHNMVVTYALATPTDTTITDTDLIAQLEAIRTASLENGTNTITNTATGTNLAGDMEIGYYGYNPRNRYDKWLWLDINNEYEQIGGE